MSNKHFILPRHIGDPDGFSRKRSISSINRASNQSLFSVTGTTTADSSQMENVVETISCFENKLKGADYQKPALSRQENSIRKANSKFDTGSDVSVISNKIAKSNNNIQSVPSLHAANGTIIKTFGYKTVQLT